MARFQQLVYLLALLQVVRGLITPVPFPAAPSATGVECRNNCTIYYPTVVAFSWTKIEFITTITAATIVEVVNTVFKTTRTTTIFNELPSNYVAPPTNSEGRHIEKVTYIRSGVSVTTTLTFPTNYIAWPDAYTWNGTLGTSFSDVSTCVTANAASVVPLPSFPQPQAPTDTIDDNGMYFSLWRREYYTDFETFSNIGAKDSCTFTHPSVKPTGVGQAGPVIPQLTARFLTETATAYEGSDRAPLTLSSEVVVTSVGPQATVSSGTNKSTPGWMQFMVVKIVALLNIAFVTLL